MWREKGPSGSRLVSERSDACEERHDHSLLTPDSIRQSFFRFAFGRGGMKHFSYEGLRAVWTLQFYM